jgi:hypothetical protein
MRLVAATGAALEGSYSQFGGWGGKEAVRKETKEELRSVVGRMMWEECWGRFCVDVPEGGARRWWEDNNVMEECVGMGTAWEVLVMEAGKDG